MPDGTVFPCRRFPVSMGNLRQHSLKEIWETSELLKVLGRRKNLKGKCGYCDIEDCRGCRSLSFSLTGDYLAEDSHCGYQPRSSLFEDRTRSKIAEDTEKWFFVCCRYRQPKRSLHRVCNHSRQMTSKWIATFWEDLQRVNPICFSIVSTGFLANKHLWLKLLFRISICGNIH